MARNDQEILQEIRRIEGQLLVAKQICRENLKEINYLKKQQENDYILRETNRLLSMSSLNSHEHADQFNKLLRLIHEEQTHNTIQYNEQQINDETSNSLLMDLSSNVIQLESLFEYSKNLFTQPITSINNLNNTISLQEIADDPINKTIQEEKSIEISDIQKRIDLMHKKLLNIHQCDDCLIQ